MMKSSISEAEKRSSVNEHTSMIARHDVALCREVEKNFYKAFPKAYFKIVIQPKSQGEYSIAFYNKSAGMIRDIAQQANFTPVSNRIDFSLSIKSRKSTYTQDNLELQADAKQLNREQLLLFNQGLIKRAKSQKCKNLYRPISYILSGLSAALTFLYCRQLGSFSQMDIDPQALDIGGGILSFILADVVFYLGEELVNCCKSCCQPSLCNNRAATFSISHEMNQYQKSSNDNDDGYNYTKSPHYQPL